MLSIAGSDSSAGAGIQADIKAAMLEQIYATTVVTAVTAQSTGGVSSINVMSPKMVYRQLEQVFSDQIPDAVKIGMIGSIDNGKAIVDFLSHYADDIPIVVDSVLAATSGRNFAEDIPELVEFYRNELFPITTLVTPNLCEMALLSGFTKDALAESSIMDLQDKAKRLIKETATTAILLKGGHSSTRSISDLLSLRNRRGSIVHRVFSSPRIDCKNLHGTGCTLSSLMACRLAKGRGMVEAFYGAETKMSQIISRSNDYIFGNHDNGPLNIIFFKIK